MRKHVEESGATGADTTGRGRGGRFSAGRKREVVLRGPRADGSRAEDDVAGRYHLYAKRDVVDPCCGPLLLQVRLHDPEQRLLDGRAQTTTCCSCRDRRAC